MKRITFLLALALSLNGCYRDDINDLNKKYDELREEQARQADLLATYQSLLQALQDKLTVTSIVDADGGSKITFSDGTELLVTSGHTPVMTIGANGNWFVDGVDTEKKSTGQEGVSPRIVDGYWRLGDVNTGVKAEGGPSIVSIVDVGGKITFHMSDGTSVTMGKTALLGMYVLSEGMMNGANGQLAYFDYNAETNKFARNEERRLKNYAETPNDLLIYGSKMYCAITGTSATGGLVRVINPATGETVQDIPITLGTVPQQPRRLIAREGNVYVSLYPGAVACIDTLSRTPRVTGLTGTFSEGIRAFGQSLYICNSGQGTGNTISIVDIAQFTETGTITVPANPVYIVNAGNGELYFNTASVGSATPANLHVLDPATKQVTTLDVPVENIVAGKNYVYGAATTGWTYGESEFKKISIADKSVSDFTTDIDEVMFAYKLAINPLTDEVFLTQQMGQDIYRFKEDGTLVETLKAGQQNGAAVVFVSVVK
ncbi:MAG: DUF4988 domain-containing protein [Odoribacteraceae bacterium]|jgi:hypothetical protein|nr:DUF4988 domain-containing protein [Odoribacteraceae bacterium]